MSVKWEMRLTRKIFSRCASEVDMRVCGVAMPALLIRTVGGEASRTREIVSLMEESLDRSVLW